MSTALKALHDQLLAERPDGAEHDEQTCPLCAMEALEQQEPEGGSMSFTQEDLDAAVAAATTPLQTRLAELEAAAQETEVGKAVTEATAPLQQQITDLQAELDEAVLARTTAETAKADTDKWWTDAINEKTEADRIEACRADRLEKVREVAAFPEEYLEKNADRFAAMSDEDFEARLEEYRTIAAKEEGSEAIPTATALTAAREGAAGAKQFAGSMLSELPSLRHALTDPRTL